MSKVTPLSRGMYDTVKGIFLRILSERVKEQLVDYIAVFGTDLRRPEAI